MPDELTERKQRNEKQTFRNSSPQFLLFLSAKRSARSRRPAMSAPTSERMPLFSPSKSAYRTSKITGVSATMAVTMADGGFFQSPIEAAMPSVGRQGLLPSTHGQMRSFCAREGRVFFFTSRRAHGRTDICTTIKMMAGTRMPPNTRMITRRARIWNARCRRDREGLTAPHRPDRAGRSRRRRQNTTPSKTLAGKFSMIARRERHRDADQITAMQTIPGKFNSSQQSHSIKRGTGHDALHRSTGGGCQARQRLEIAVSPMPTEKKPLRRKKRERLTSQGCQKCWPNALKKAARQDTTEFAPRRRSGSRNDGRRSPTAKTTAW